MAEKLVMLALSPTMEQGKIIQWVKKEGEEIHTGDVLCEVETDKATMDYESTSDGILLKILSSEGSEVSVGEDIAIVGEQDEDISGLNSDSSVEPSTPKEQTVPEPVQEQNSRIESTPVARAIAAQNGLNLKDVDGTGPNGRIIKRDIVKVLSVSGPDPVQTKPIQKVEMSGEKIPLSGMRRTIAERMVQSKLTAPHYYLKLKVIMDELMTDRKSLNSKQKEKVSMNAFIIKLVAQTLLHHPLINASWNEDEIVVHNTIDIGLAVALEDGLIAPVVRDCGNKGIMDIDKELKLLIDKTKNNKLDPEDYSDPTFTITNLGSFGIEEFTAIINQPGSAILAIGKIERLPEIIEDNKFKAVSKMSMTLSCDHRVIDGAVGARFLSELKDLIEHPVSMLY
jgi:pyruvate dehydrogenase E2 component (dihydrolipoamide acetyltransferase)